MTTKVIITILGVGVLAIVGFMFFKRRTMMNGGTTTPASPLNPAAPPDQPFIEEQAGLFAKAQNGRQMAGAAK